MEVEEEPMRSQMRSRARVLATYLASPGHPIPDKPSGAVRLVCQSDTHARVESAYRDGRVVVPPGDVYVHAGDFSSHGLLGEFQIFHDYVARLPHTHKIVIAGNHDLTMEKDYYLARGRQRFHFKFPQDPDACRAVFTESRDLIYLQDTGINVCGLQFWGAPWQPEFFDWGFNLQRGAEIKRKWDLIPDHIDVLITHGPPMGFGDRVESGQRVGCEELAKAIRERIKPAVHVFGHIHEGYGMERDTTTHYINASTCTLRYRPTNPCIVVDVLPAEGSSL